MLADRWRKGMERILRTADRFTHSGARRQASLRMLRRAAPKRVTVICYGNICRSPYAAAYLRKRLLENGDLGISVDSAGLIGPGRPANAQGSSIALARGVDLAGHRSRLFERAEAGQADLVLVMTRSHQDQLLHEFGVSPDRIELLGGFDLADPPYLEIADPYGRSDDEFRRVFSQIERSVDGLCHHWGQNKFSDHRRAGPRP